MSQGPSSGHSPLVLHDVQSGITVHESGGCVSTTSAAVRDLPRRTSRRLRLDGNFKAAHDVLKAARISQSSHTQDLVEFLLVLSESGRVPGASGPRQLVQQMLDVVRASPARWNRAVGNVILSACVREAARTGDNAAVVKREFLLGTASEIWRTMCESACLGDRSREPDQLTVTLLYRVCGECNALQEARQVHTDAIAMDKARGECAGEQTVAAYILCLGKCGRSVEAEELYLSGEGVRFRSSPSVLDALFQAHIASDRISKAEALIAQHGAEFLNVQSCNAFVKRCAILCLREKAADFVVRMRTGAQFPRPNRFTYNLLIKTLVGNRAGGAEEVQMSADHALRVVDQMLKDGIEPNVVTYNTLILNLADQGRLAEAMALYSKMIAPDYLTFSHLMMGAAKTGDIVLARRLKNDLDALDRVYPNYNFCKKLLVTVALAEGIDAAFDEAQKISIQYANELKMFGDVGGREAVRMALIHACGVVGDLSNAFAALRFKLAGSDSEVGMLAPLYIATTLMQVCIDCNAQGQALEVFHSIKRAGVKPNFEVYEKLIHGLVSTRQISGTRPCPSGMDDLDAQGHFNNKENASGEEGEKEESIFVDAGSSLVTKRPLGARPPVCANSSPVARGDIDDALDVSFPDHDGSDPACTEYVSDQSDCQIPNSLDIALALFSEMHHVGAARPLRPACYMYNTLIAAIARTGNLDLAFQLFLKMCRHNNPGVVYFSCTNKKDGIAYQQGMLRWGSELAELGFFDVGMAFPASVPATYASMIQAGRICGRPDLSFSVYEAMQADRINEPTQATYSLLTDVALDFAGALGVGPMQRLLKKLDDLKFISPDLRVKRGVLRKLLLAFRWKERDS